MPEVKAFINNSITNSLVVHEKNTNNNNENSQNLLGYENSLVNKKQEKNYAKNTDSFREAGNGCSCSKNNKCVIY